jgi:hypothetical protein
MLPSQNTKLIRCCLDFRRIPYVQSCLLTSNIQFHCHLINAQWHRIYIQINQRFVNLNHDKDIIIIRLRSFSHPTELMGMVNRQNYLPTERFHIIHGDILYIDDRTEDAGWRGAHALLQHLPGYFEVTPADLGGYKRLAGGGKVFCPRNQCISGRTRVVAADRPHRDGTTGRRLPRGG